MENVKVLIVDDEPNIRDLLSTSLRFAGFSVHAVANGADAVMAAEKGAPDIILLDVMLPDMNGFSVTKKLRSMGINAPVLFLTARDETEDKITGLTVGGDDYVTKPFSPRELIARIRALLRRSPVAGTIPYDQFLTHRHRRSWQPDLPEWRAAKATGSYRDRWHRRGERARQNQTSHGQRRLPQAPKGTRKCRQCR